MNGHVEPWLAALLAGIISTLSTGLGAFPVVFISSKSRHTVAIMYAIAAGFMISASVFSIASEGLHLGSPAEVTIGFIAGGLFLTLAARLMPEGDHAAIATRRSKLMLLALFTHSIPEGIAIGVGFATGNPGFGVLMALAISIHNIPEGTAMSLPLRDEGASLNKCFWYSVLTSLPQGLLALPAFLIANKIKVLVPGMLAFAGGAMIFLVVFDLLPEAYKSSKNHTAIAWGFLGGLTLMMLLTVWLQSFSFVG